MHRGELKPEQKALLDEMSRSANPRAEALQQLEYELESSAVARQAFGAELLRLRQFRDTVNRNKRSLPWRLREALNSLPRPRSFAELCAIADRLGEPRPEREPGLET